MHPLLPAWGEGVGRGVKISEISLLGGKRGVVRNLYFGVGGCYWDGGGGGGGSHNFEIKIKTV